MRVRNSFERVVLSFRRTANSKTAEFRFSDGTELDAESKQIVATALGVAGGGGGGVVADGSITTPKLADASVTAAKVAADVATQAELDTGLATKLNISTATATYGRLVSESVPRSRRVWAVGDSITDNGNPGVSFSSGRINGLQLFQSHSYLGAALANLDGRVRVGGVAATPGFTAEQILATHVPTIVANASRGDTVVVLAGTNNAPGADLATYLTTMTTIYNTLDAAGLIVVPGTIPPNKTPAQYVQFIQAANAWIYRTAVARGYSVADFYRTLVDPATGSYLAAYDSGDHTHPSAAGAWAMGVELARAIRARVESVRTQSLFDTNAYPAGLIGTTNAVLLTDTNADGIPDGWALLAGAGTSTHVLATDATNYVGKKLTMTRGDTNDLLRSGSFTLVPGNRVLFGVKFKATAAAGGNWSIRVENVGGSGTLVGYTGITQTSAATPALVVWDFVVPSGWPTYVFRVDLYCQTGAATSLEIGEITVRDLTAEGVA